MTNMTPIEINENNKLIAKFMGATIFPTIDPRVEVAQIDVPFQGNLNVCLVCQLEYHKSLDWLVPVLEKIEKLGCIVEVSWALVVTCRICIIGAKHERSWSIIRQSEDKHGVVDIVYLSVIDYIKYYYDRSDSR